VSLCSVRSGGCQDHIAWATMARWLAGELTDPPYRGLSSWLTARGLAERGACEQNRLGKTIPPDPGGTMKPPSRLFSPNTRWQCDRCNQTFRRRELRYASLGEATLLCERCRARREIRTEPCGCQVQYRPDRRRLGGVPHRDAMRHARLEDRD
jgi:hypothetical protein